MNWLPSYDEFVKWRWGFATWKFRYKLISGFLVIGFGVLFAVRYLGPAPIRESTGGPGQSIAVDRSSVGGDVILGDKIYGLIEKEVAAPSQGDEVIRRKITVTIRRSIEDAGVELDDLRAETDRLKDQIAAEYNARGMLRSGRYLKAQADRVKSFQQAGFQLRRTVDRNIEDALAEQKEDTFDKAEWLAEERELYQGLSERIIAAQDQVKNETGEHVKHLGYESDWHRLMEEQ